MSLLKTCLVCLVAAVAAASPPVVPSRRRPNFSSMFKSNDLMKNKMADLTSRVARMEQRDDQQKDALEKMTKDVYQITNNLQLTFKDVSHRMDLLEQRLTKRPATRPVSQGQTGPATVKKELAAQNVPEKDAEISPPASQKAHAKVGQNVNQKTRVNPMLTNTSHKKASQNVHHNARSEVVEEVKDKVKAVAEASNPKMDDMKDSSKVRQGKDNNDGNDDKENDKDANQTNKVEQKELPKEEITAMIEACGRPPISEGLSAEVSMYGGKIMATYTCSKQYVLITPDKVGSVNCTDGVWSTTKVFCSNLTTCGHTNGVRMRYNGTVSVTKTGKECQSWTSQSPHWHRYNRNFKFSQTNGFEGGETPKQASNYCRDPGVLTSIGQVWCFTTDPNTRWEKCDVPVCGQGK